MNSMAVSTETIIEAKMTIKVIEDIICWACIKIKPTKSGENVQREVLSRRTYDNLIIFRKTGTGQVIDTDNQNVKVTSEQLENWMNTIDKCALLGKNRVMEIQAWRCFMSIPQYAPAISRIDRTKDQWLPYELGDDPGSQEL